MHYLLHIDTSSDVATIALCGNGNVLAEQQTSDNRNFAASINDGINKVLFQCNIILRDIDGIAVCSGPGSYTGLRIGMATAKAFCYVLDKPLLLHDKLTLLAHQKYSINKTCDIYLSILKAREGEFFISTHDLNFNCIDKPRLVFEENLKDIVRILAVENNILYTGDVPQWISNERHLAPMIDLDSSLNINSWGLYAYQQYSNSAFADLSYAEPFYLKEVYVR